MNRATDQRARIRTAVADFLDQRRGVEPNRFHLERTDANTRRLIEEFKTGDYPGAYAPWPRWVAHVIELATLERVPFAEATERAAPFLRLLDAYSEVVVCSVWSWRHGQRCEPSLFLPLRLHDEFHNLAADLVRSAEEVRHAAG